MPHAPHQTTPFRRPSSSWPQDVQPDPAEVGTAFGLELCLAGAPGNPADGTTARQDEPQPDDDGEQGAAPAPPSLCP